MTRLPRSLYSRDNGYLLPDLTNKCSAVQPMDASEDRRCVVKLAWLWIDTASFRYCHYS